MEALQQVDNLVLAFDIQIDYSCTNSKTPKN